MTSLILIRGAPGSGKTSFAKAVFGDFLLVEADDFFMKDGVYQFDPMLLDVAHAYCREKVKNLLANHQKVIVANTFSRLWEMKPYLEMTNNLDIIRLDTQFQNIHGVPDRTVTAIRERMQPYEGEIIITEAWWRVFGSRMG